MEARAPGRTHGLVLAVVLCVLRSSPGAFTDSHSVTETYFSVGTDDSERSTEFPSAAGTATSEGTARAPHAPTSRTSELHPSSSEPEPPSGSQEQCCLSQLTPSEGAEHPEQRASSLKGTEQSSLTEVTETWTTQNRSDIFTELSNPSSAYSTNTMTEREDPSIIPNITDTFTIAEQVQSEFRTVRDLTMAMQTELDHTDQDPTVPGSNSDSTYISTTLSRAGERTLLSITSNSTSPYMENTSSSFSETAAHAVTGQVEKTGITQPIGYTDGGLSTGYDRSEVMSEDFVTNATLKEVLKTEVSQDSQITQSHTGQPTATGSDFESMPNTSNPSSTPLFTVINSSNNETGTTDNFSTSQDFYTVLPDDTHPNVSGQDSKTTETTDPVNTSADEKPNEPQTFKEDTTIAGLSTASSTLWDISTSVASQSTQQTFTFQTPSSPDPTVELNTVAETSTNSPSTEEDMHEPSTILVTSTMIASTGTTVPLTTTRFQESTTAKANSTPYSTLSTLVATEKTTPTTEQHHPTTGTPTPSLMASPSHSGAGSTDLSTLHFETSTATPGSTTAHHQHTTASYSKNAPTMSTMAVTTGKHSTATEATTTQMPVTLSLTPVHMCKPQTCANGGKCVLTSGGYSCECLPSWRGENCTEDVDECVRSPCPEDSVCVNTRGSFRCDCSLGYDLQDGRRCTQMRTFLGIFHVNGSLHKTHGEILQLLNASLSNLAGYRRSTLQNLDSLNILAVNMFSMSAEVTSFDIFCRIQKALKNCTTPQTLCSLKLQHLLRYKVGSLCAAQKKRCDTQHAVCNDSYGTPYCQCAEGYFKNNPEDSTCRDCGDGFKLVNGTCMECAFGFGGFNCNNFYGLIAKVVSPAAGGLLLIIIIALIITYCRKDKNDINKIIFKSGDLQMSPYGEFPKNSRVSMEWGRETIEMQENGSTKNLLQMTDIYYSPALRNADLERNGLYPFSGLPGSRHSCIYPAQWNPSFICDDSRRRDYF